VIRVLLPVDGSENAARAVHPVARCSQRIAPVEVQLLYVQQDDGTAFAALDEPARNDALEAGNRALQSASAVLRRAGIACTSESRKGFVPSVIIQYAKSANCDAIVMARAAWDRPSRCWAPSLARSSICRICRSLW